MAHQELNGGGLVCVNQHAVAGDGNRNRRGIYLGGPRCISEPDGRNWAPLERDFEGRIVIWPSRPTEALVRGDVDKAS